MNCPKCNNPMEKTKSETLTFECKKCSCEYRDNNGTLEKIPLLFSEPIKQQAWYLMTKASIDSGRALKRPIDKMPIAEILKMFKEENFICDDCGARMGKMPNTSLVDHIAHLINPSCGFTCEKCMLDLYKTGNIIAGDVSGLLKRNGIIPK